ncbi:hypothetical protein F2P81_014785 [Scophthalmus maximus]|uniref:Uncharacterized protein n=1 Tax=Scophthalmus maximus TaxID=52904 RepID=A0A6A4SIR8_SCOMX|nr:hypothetical protein F2P81_014785 [Scophthalmus maximus]
MKAIDKMPQTLKDESLAAKTTLFAGDLNKGQPGHISFYVDLGPSSGNITKLPTGVYRAKHQSIKHNQESNNEKTRIIQKPKTYIIETASVARSSDHSANGTKPLPIISGAKPQNTEHLHVSNIVKTRIIHKPKTYILANGSVAVASDHSANGRKPLPIISNAKPENIEHL